MSWRRRVRNVRLAGLLALAVAYSVFPIYFVTIQSLKTPEEDVFGHPLYVARPTFVNYTELFEEGEQRVRGWMIVPTVPFLLWLQNSAVVFGAAVAVTLDHPRRVARSSSPLSLDEEEQLIEELFRRLEQQHYDPENILAVRHAVALSRALYEGKTFASGEGFLRHALKVALTLVDWKTEVSVVLAGLFHKLPVGELEEILGPEALQPFAHLGDRDLSGVRDLIRRLYNITTYWPYVGGYIHSVEGQKTLQNYMNAIIQLSEGDPSTLLLVFADKIQAVPAAATKAEMTYRYQELDHIYTRLAPQRLSERPQLV